MDYGYVISGNDCITDRTDIFHRRNDRCGNLAAVHATPEELSPYPTDESAIRIAVLDSGTCIIEDVEVQEYVNLVPEEDDILPLYADGTGHGTAVAGIIAAKDDNEGIIGVAPDASIYSVKVFDTINEAPISRIIRGIYWAIDHDMNIVNMSFGTTVNSYALHQAIQDAYQDGILMIAAAGNKGVMEYPAAYNEVIAVGALDYEGKRSEFSATGESLELMAPGECVLSDSFYGGVMAVDGTSIAAPHVAGAAAVLWAKDTTKSSDFIRQLLNASANSSQASEEYGNGILDVRHAFEIYEDFEAVYIPGVNEYAGIVENVAEYVIGDEPEYVVGSWGASEHNSSIQTGAAADSSLYNTKNIKVMQWISRRLDTDFVADPNTAANFHGGQSYGTKATQQADNYVNDLFFLYEVAITLKNLPAGSSIAEQERAVDAVANNRRNKNSVSIHSFFVSQVKELLSYTSSASNNGVTYSDSELKTPQVNTIKILGAAIHLAEDIYAHRTLVPYTAMNNTIESASDSGITGNYFAKNHFDSNVSECEISTLAETAYNRHSKTVTLCHDKTWSCFSRAVSNMCVEFKDIYTWTNKNAKRGTYEDNPKFYNERFTVGTNYTVKYLMKKYKEGEKTLDSNVLLAGANGYIFNLKLNNLKGYYVAMGLPWVSGWSAYSTEQIE